MRMEWTDTPPYGSAIAVRIGDRSYNLLITTKPDPEDGSEAYNWEVFEFTRLVTGGWGANDYDAKRCAETVLLELIEPKIEGSVA